MTIEAKIICDSISPQGIRLTTMQLRYPKFIHGEMMTHRVFSRNASSSRAVPTAKLLEEVRSDALRAAPVFWGKNQPGMQAAEELEDTVRRHLVGQSMGDQGHTVTDRAYAKGLWRSAALFAVMTAEQMLQAGVHKQLVNRLLEPFSHINVVVTATEWDNFFGLRLHADAQPEMRALAQAMWDARQASLPMHREPGNWHLPFVDDETVESCVAWERLESSFATGKNASIKVSVARCARVSYMSNDTSKRSTVEEDLRLYDRLLGAQPLHASPAEHQATPDEWGGQKEGWLYRHEWGNFCQWRQYRKMIPNEAVAPLPEEYLK